MLKHVSSRQSHAPLAEASAAAGPMRHVVVDTFEVGGVPPAATLLQELSAHDIVPSLLRSPDGGGLWRDPCIDIETGESHERRTPDDPRNLALVHACDAYRDGQQSPFERECPLRHDIFDDAVFLADVPGSAGDAHTYDRSFFTRYLQTQRRAPRSPLTNRPIGTLGLVENRQIQRLCLYGRMLEAPLPPLSPESWD